MQPFLPTRTAGLDALRQFVPVAGSAYAARRNEDVPGHPNVSRLSPYIRHRLITEEEVLRSVLARHSATAATKFVQEVFWRTYWKGWLEMRPSVWQGYQTGLRHARDRLATEGGLRRDWEAACTGSTGIAAVDHWARELTATGYLHNHARMWFASIWIFTLRLPWELGADFFLRNLLDGDPASNTLGWRWVAGIQTPGKVYVARADNIARYTAGRFGAADGLSTLLARDPAPIEAPPPPPPTPLPSSDPVDPDARTGLIVTEDDLSPAWLLADTPTPVASAFLSAAALRSPLDISRRVAAFTHGAFADMQTRHADRLGTPEALSPLCEGETIEGQSRRLIDWAKANGLTQIVGASPPIGPAQEALTTLRPILSDHGVTLALRLRPYDSAAWPYATHGFFRFRDKIPKLLARLIP